MHNDLSYDNLLIQLSIKSHFRTSTNDSLEVYLEDGELLWRHAIIFFITLTILVYTFRLSYEDNNEAHYLRYINAKIFHIRFISRDPIGNGLTEGYFNI